MQINSMPQQTPIMQVQMIAAVSAGGQCCLTEQWYHVRPKGSQ